ncbi:MAG: SRPBCC family protein [Mycobacterium leprae]
MTEFVIRKTVRAKPETVFGVFTDHRGYAKLVGPIRTSELEREGDPAPNGVGAIRALRMPGATVREQVMDFDRPDHYSYRMLSGAPLRDYVSTVTFTPTERGTEVAYSVSAVPTVPGIRFAIGYLVKVAIRLFVRRAAAQAERIG